MKTLNSYILLHEKYLIDKDFNSSLTLDDFIKELQSEFNIKKFDAVGITDIILDNFSFGNADFNQLENDTQNHELFNNAAELLNHPLHKIDNHSRIYILSVIDLYIYAYDKDNSNKFVYFIDHLNDKIYIYKVNKK